MSTTDQAEQTRSYEIANSPELETAMSLAQQAGEILKKYHQTNLEVDYKKDEFDPVSIADRESDAFLRAGITKAFPGDEILSEESPLKPSAYDGRVWFIDPLDDTKGYLAGRDTAGVMIGLRENDKPTVGVVYLPFRNEWYYAEAGKGAFFVKHGETTRLQVPSTITIEDATLVGRNALVGDRRPIDDAIAELPFKGIVPEGCIGAKIGLIARGKADVFIHTNLKAGKWDTLASEVILGEAGGVMTDIDGVPLDYTKPDNGWDRFFIAACTPELLNTVVTRLNEINETTHSF